jgi:hypothetical protein
VSSWLGLRVETWWWLEKRSQHLWERACRDDEVSCWLDWLPAFTYQHRKQAERRRFERKHGVPL